MDWMLMDARPAANAPEPPKAAMARWVKVDVAPLIASLVVPVAAVGSTALAPVDAVRPLSSGSRA